MAEKEVVEMAKSVVEEVKKINEILKDTRISKLCDEISAYAKALERAVHGFIIDFAYRFYGDNVAVYDIFSADRPIELWTGALPSGQDIAAVLRTVVTSDAFKGEVMRKMLLAIAELGKELADKADIVRRVEELEKRLVDDP
jgi:hypothetical protein